MGVKLLPPRLYKSELANSESLRDTLLLVELDTVKKEHSKYMFHFVFIQFDCTTKCFSSHTQECLKFYCSGVIYSPEDPKPPRAEPKPTPREPPVLLKPREELGGGAADVCENRELL